MHITALYIHPIKSLLPLSVPSSSLNALGFPHDRTFLLQRLDTAPPSTCHIAFVPALCLFAQSLGPDNTLIVTHTPSGATTSLSLTPATDALPTTEITMHRSPCTAHILPAAGAFFTAHLGFPVRLLYLGANTRAVLGNIAPPEAAAADGARIGFADCAPLLFASTASLADVATRLPEGFDGDIRRFRPNIVLAPDEGEELAAWEEDYWGAVEIGGGEGAGVKVALTANCARCTSLNVDFETGKTVDPGMQPLKALMRDRRVDEGIKYSPVFGRYGFLEDAEGEGKEVRVGDRVTVVRKNEERTKFFWPGLSTGTRVAT
ncbi:MOSC domain-containing protein [Geopyxis carbonaria]|nr:MOSC domain-containing protein [Geopyxis carbonaria]